MRARFLKRFKRDMIRPIIYKSSSRFAYLLTAALIWDRFINRGARPNGLEWAFLLIALGFALAAWLAWLRMDGLRIPRLPARHRKVKRVDSLYGDMIDQVDEPIVEYADLDKDEQDACLMLADAICAVVYGALSLLV